MRTRAQTLKKFLHGNSGSTTVEFIAVLPLLLVALVFSFEFGRALWAYNIISSDIRGAVRYISRTSLPVSPDCPQAAMNIATRGVIGGSSSADHFPWAGASPSFTCNNASFPTGFNQSVSVVTMSASVPLTLSLISFFSARTGNSVPTSYTYTLVVADRVRWVGY